MLEVQKATYQYPSFHMEFDLTIQRGESVAIMGQSGSGKTTLLSLIAGFLFPKTGAIKWQGNDISKKKPHLRNMSTIFQDYNLFEHLNVEQNIGLGLHTKIRLNSDDKEKIEKALDCVGLNGFQNRKPYQLSGGQQKRIAIARSLVRKTPILLFDEAFSSLDEDRKHDIFKLINQLRHDENLTILFVTHDPGEAKMIGDKILTVKNGSMESFVKIN